MVHLYHHNLEMLSRNMAQIQNHGSDHQSDQLEQTEQVCSAKYISQSSSSEEDQSSVHMNRLISPKGPFYG